MELIMQPTSTTCGQACIAMITGKSIEEVEKDTDRDNFLSAKEALEYGIIDKVFDRRK